MKDISTEAKIAYADACHAVIENIFDSPLDPMERLVYTMLLYARLRSEWADCFQYSPKGIACATGLTSQQVWAVMDALEEKNFIHQGDGAIVGEVGTIRLVPERLA